MMILFLYLYQSRIFCSKTAGPTTTTTACAVTFEMTFISTGAITDSTLNAIKNSFATSLQSNMYPVSPSDISLSINPILGVILY